jgi:hypothetical protein
MSHQVKEVLEQKHGKCPLLGLFIDICITEIPRRKIFAIALTQNG